MNWYLKVMKDFLNFSGRARRKEYWMFVLIYIGISIVGSILDGILKIRLGGVGIIGAIIGLVHLVPSVAVGIRRMHDIGRSGWYLLLSAVPAVLTSVLAQVTGSFLIIIGGAVVTLIASIVVIVWLAKDGQPGDNAYGSNPKAVL